MPGQLLVVGLGTGHWTSLPYRNYRLLQQSGAVYVRSLFYPQVLGLQRRGIRFIQLMESGQKPNKEDPQAVVEYLLQQVQRQGQVVLAEPGKILTQQVVVQQLLIQAHSTGAKIRLYPVPAEAVYPLDPLVEVMNRLRGEGGCQWDREQNHQSLKRYLIEETYEVIEAIEEQNMNKLVDELGDLLLQIVFHARLASENDYFDLNGVIAQETTKMIRRHPHVFGELKVDSSEQVLLNWDKIKTEIEGKRDLMEMPGGLPALMQADKVQNRAARLGFDWDDPGGPREKIEEELKELDVAMSQGDQVAISDELGDVLFSIVNLARWLRIDAEDSLRQSVKRFGQRFTWMEQYAETQDFTLTSLTMAEMEELWQKAKLNTQNR